MGEASFLAKVVARANRAVAALIRTRAVRMANARPIVSFTFDDFPKSALRGAQILSSNNVSGTFYLSSCFSGRTVDGNKYYDLSDVEFLLEDKHEIGCHTASHARVSLMRRGELAATLDRNAEFAWKNFNIELATFSFPFGDFSLSSKLLVQRRFDACRSSLPGVNRGVADLGALRAVKLYSQLIQAEFIRRLIERHARPHSWLIFYTHDIDEKPSAFGCTPALFETAVDAVIDAGCRVLSVKDALRALSESPGS